MGVYRNYFLRFSLTSNFKHFSEILKRQFIPLLIGWYLYPSFSIAPLNVPFDM